jgi:hypothetical protein
MMAAFGESLALAATGGVPLGRFIEVLQASGFHSPLYLMKGEQIINDDFEPRFSLALAAKDLRLAAESADDQSAEMPVSGAVRRLFGRAVASDRGAKDMAAVADMLLEWTRTGAAAGKDKSKGKGKGRTARPAKAAARKVRPAAKAKKAAAPKKKAGKAKGKR